MYIHIGLLLLEETLHYVEFTDSLELRWCRDPSFRMMEILNDNLMWTRD